MQTKVETQGRSFVSLNNFNECEICNLEYHDSSSDLDSSSSHGILLKCKLTKHQWPWGVLEYGGPYGCRNKFCKVTCTMCEL